MARQSSVGYRGRSFDSTHICWMTSWRPRRHSIRGEVPYLLPVPPHLPWELGHHGQDLHTGRIVHSERRWGSVEDSNLERLQLLQPRSNLAHLRPQCQPGSTHLRAGNVDGDGPGQHHFHLDYIDRLVQHISTLFPCPDHGSLRRTGGPFKHPDLWVAKPRH